MAASTHDVVIRGGLVIDGTGAPGERADVAINDGRISEVGTVTGRAARTIDATDCWVTPGFIDPHTHLDAQLCWDGRADPSNLHGFTTVVVGLCGFGVAPCPARGGEYLLRSLERVEEIPYASTSRGVPFEWTSWREYFDFVGRQPLAVNVAGFVPHSALRYFAMGERARGDIATEQDRTAMVRELADALAAGALGFATSRGPNHVDGYGDPVPSRFADDAELQDLVAACRGRLWQINVKAKFGRDAGELTGEVARYAEWSAAAGARLTWSPFHADTGNDVWRAVIAHNRALNEAGTVVLPQVSALPIGVLLRFDEPSFFARVGGWEQTLDGFYTREPAARLALLSDPHVRDALRTSDRSALFAPDFAEWIIAASPSQPGWVGQTLASVGEGDPVGALCDLIVADQLATLIVMAVANRDRLGIAQLISDAHTLLALGDAGAHVMSVTNYRYPTYMLGELVPSGELSLEHAVQLLTSKPATMLGWRDRGRIALRHAGDVCVIDPAQLSAAPVEVVHDLPGGAPRLYQRARGFRAVLVNGVVTVAADTATASAPGQLLRS